MVAETMILMEMPRSIHFRQLPGGAILSIKKATETLPMAILSMHIDREIVLSSSAFDN